MTGQSQVTKKKHHKKQKGHAEGIESNFCSGNIFICLLCLTVLRWQRVLILFKVSFEDLEHLVYLVTFASWPINQSSDLKCC